MQGKGWRQISGWLLRSFGPRLDGPSMKYSMAAAGMWVQIPRNPFYKEGGGSR